jgi:hypothetical protein
MPILLLNCQGQQIPCDVTAEQLAEFEEGRRKFDQHRKEMRVRALENPSVQTIREYLWLHKSTERPWLFLMLWCKIEEGHDALFWKSLHDQWHAFDLIDHRDFKLTMLARRAAWRPEYMCEDDHAAYRALPEMVTIYRGQERRSRGGLAWTTDPKVARFFAKGFRSSCNQDPVVIEARVKKSAIAGIYTDRQESEVMLFDSSAAKKRKVFTLADFERAA